MNWGGKVAGGVLGAVVGGPIGALIGVVVGHQFDAGAIAVGGFAGTVDPSMVNQLFYPAAFRVMGHVAKADGRVSEREIAAARGVMQALRLNAAQTQAAIDYFTEGKQPAFDLGAEMRRLRPALAMHGELARFFLEIQLQAALEGNDLAGVARERLRHVAQLLGLRTMEFQRIEQLIRFRTGAGHPGGDAADAPARGAQAGERLAQAYSLLKCEATMSDEQIVKAYRRQMSQHHPDKLAGRGMPDSMIERAKQRTQAIQAAYELVRRARGMR